MAISVGEKIRKKLPEKERANIEELLRDKSGGVCFLCDAELNETTQTIVPDHDIPEAEGGETTFDNLNLAHKTCNSLKQNHTSVEIRPFLRIANFISERESDQGPVYYHDCLEYLGVKPQRISMQRKGDKLTLHLPDGRVETVPVFSEERQGEDEPIEFAFAELPPEAMFHDAKCQPRSIKTVQLKKIFFDLVRNPLHEQPTVRVDGSGKTRQLLLFDGQHKALAKWISESEAVVVKIYLNLSQEQANFLVNSIQSVVPKLPLTPFELAVKMSDEYQESFERYREVAEGEESEDGFVKWLPTTDRPRGRKEIKNALVALVLDHEEPELLIRERVNAKELGIRETQFISKVLGQLMELKPLKTGGKEGQRQRENERVNVVKVLNLFEEICLAPGSEEQAAESDKIRTKRMLYQASLGVCMELLFEVTKNQAGALEPFLEKHLNEKELGKISDAIKKMSKHPIWTVDLSKTAKTRAVDEALSKNQGQKEAFKGVHMDFGYLLGEPLADDWKE